MKSRKTNNGYLVRLEKGEELVESLQTFCVQNRLQSGWISGLGGALKARLGYYNLNRKKYIFRSVKDARELVSLQGNIAIVGGEVALHLHGVVTDSNNKPRGGHIQQLVVGGTCEILIQTFEEPIERALDDEIGLPLMQL